MSLRPRIHASIVFALIALGVWVSAQTQTPRNALQQGFVSPPDSAKLRTWWHWTGSNVTKEGITKDLEWMKRVGIGGFMMFDVSNGSGQTVEPKTVVFTPEWYDALRHTATEAARLGLEMTLHSSAGWSETGGPWVKPEEAIKKVVWSETRVNGPRRIAERLTMPPSNNGPFQNLPPGRGRGAGAGAPPPPPDPIHYADSVVVAYRTPESTTVMVDAKPRVTSNAGIVAADALFDSDLTTAVTVPMMEGSSEAWIQLEFATPFLARAMTIAAAGSRGFGSGGVIPIGKLQASDDGRTFRTLVALPGQQHDIRDLGVRTYTFPETRARFYRVDMTSPLGGTSSLGPNQRTPPTTRQYGLTELELHADGRVNRYQDKAHFAPMFEYESITTPAVPDSALIKRADVIDLTSRIDRNGLLTWDVPEGRWTILRMGSSLTGAKNGPAVPAGVGYEVDKLSARHLESYYRGYTNPIAKALGPLFGKGLQYFLVDSFEANAQNWTDEMIAEFRRRRGYDPTPYMPALAGRVVESAEASDRFLWDFRRTIGDLFAEQHYEAFAKLAHEQGIKVYSEAMGVSLPFIGDALQNKGRVDIPMGEFFFRPQWIPPTAPPYRGAGDRPVAYWSDVREAASASRLYGKQIVGAESWTGGGYEAPYSLKWPGDYYATQGVNRYIFHTSAHQPLDTKPGNTMVGTHLNRNITWAELAGPFITYLNRNMFMLQQGQFVGDVVYFLGEGVPASVPYWEKLKPEPPKGYDFDFMNAEILLTKTSVRDGKIVVADGPTYSVLVLPVTDAMTPHVARKIGELVAAGATVLGPKPLRSPSLAGYPASDAVVLSIAHDVWGDVDGRTVLEHAYGKGRVLAGVSLVDALTLLQIPRDVDYAGIDPDTYLETIHRRIDNTDIYFISNQRDRSEDVKVRFRVANMAPELWHSDTGTIEPAAYETADGRTTVSLSLEPRDSVFVVFRQPTSTPRRAAPRHPTSTIGTVAGQWTVSFPAGLGAPSKIEMPTVGLWTAHAEDGVKYFSGTATYTKTVQAPASWFRAGTRTWLDLGMVKDLAEVSVNGKQLGSLWKPPYRVDVTGVLRTGANQVEIKVTNQWTNRIARDRTLPPERRVLPSLPAAGLGAATAPDTLPPVIASGLAGPVTILASTTTQP